MQPTKQSIQQAHKRIKKYIHRTPLLSSSIITQKAQCKSLFLKCQNLQKIGAFKPRGAANKLLKLDPKIKTVCCHSSGNHAQAVAYMSQKLGLKAYIVMPDNSPTIKKQAAKGYGATVIISGNTIQQRISKCKQVMEKYNAQLIHAYDDYDTIEGQSTSAKEAFQDYQQDFDFLVFPIGGGGLASGSILSAKYFGKGCKPIGVQPYLARDAYIGIQKGIKQPQFPPISIADGLRTQLGDKTFKIIKQNLTTDQIILVSEEQMINTTQLVLERMKIVIQPSSASVVAAVLKDSRFKDKKVCCIISGGNIDMSQFFKHLKEKAKL